MGFRPHAHTLAFSIALLPLLLGSAAAHACVSCNTGDPTLTTMGEEQPYAWRTRAGTFLRLWGQRTEVAGHDHAHTSELLEARLDVSASVAPVDWLVFALTLPVQARQLLEGHQPAVRFVVPGELDFGVRAILWRDRRFSPNHLLSAVAGLKLPTAPVLRDGSGQPLDFHDQVGSGSVDPRVGATYSLFLSRWSGQAGVVLQWPTRGHEGYRKGPTLRGLVSAQYQAAPWLGLRLGVEGRRETQDFRQGAPVAGTGGFIGYLVPAVLIAAGPNLALQAVVHAPLVATGHTAGELPTLGMGMMLDL